MGTASHIHNTQTIGSDQLVYTNLDLCVINQVM